ncbi:MAG: FxsA family protein [Thermoguttaceae bacterium]
MFLTVFLLFPLIEIVVFLMVVHATSWSTAILMSLCTSALGFGIVKLQRKGPLFCSSHSPANILKNYLFGNLGAFALIMPGFVSDVLGLLLLIPFTRAILLKLIRWSKVDLYGGANGAFSVFRTWSFKTDNAERQPHSQRYLDYDANANDFVQYPAPVQDEPIDVEFLPQEPNERN